MLKIKAKQLLSFTGVSLLIGIVGSISAYFGFFITDWSALVSIKWPVFIIYLSLTIILFLLKLLVDMNEEMKKSQPHTASIVRLIAEHNTLLVSKNDFLGHLAMVSIFYNDDGYETEVCKGYVSSIQEKFIQIQLFGISENFQTNYENVLQRFNLNDVSVLEKIIVKSYITYTN